MKLFSSTACLAPLLALAAVACSSDTTPEDDGPRATPTFAEARSSLQRDTSAKLDDADATSFREANVAFALDLHKRLAQPNKNVAASPYSISTAVAMAYAGARGETANEIARAMHYELGPDKTHVGMNVLSRELQARAGEGKAIDGSALKLAIDNQTFAQKDTSFEAPYLDLLARHYDAGVKLVDFKAQPNAERLRINDWVASNTNQRIKDLLTEGTIDDLTRLVLVNTIHMNAAWETPFDPNKTVERAFTDEAGETLQPKTMSGEFSAPCASTETADAVTLRYSGGKLSMTAILPKGTLADFEKALDAKGLEALLAARTDQPVLVSIPRFKLEGDSVALSSHLKAMGMQLAFTNGADFTAIRPVNDLKITDVIHKAFIDVAEKGTEAAAATAVILGEKTSAPIEPPKTIVFDRPFFVAIRDEATGALLFTARVARP